MSFDRGIELLWNTQFNECLRTFEEVKSEEPLIASVHIALVHSVLALISEDAERVETSFEHLTLAIDACTVVDNDLGTHNSMMTRLLKVNPLGSTHDEEAQLNDAQQLQLMTARTFLCELTGMKMALQFRTGAFLTGAYSLRSTWKLFQRHGNKYLSQDFFSDSSNEETIAFHKKFARSTLLFGMGLFYFFVSLVPASFQWAIKLVGFQGNRQLGLEYLTTCFEENGVRSDAALLMNVWIEMFFLQNQAEAAQLLREATTRFPTGTLFLYLQGYWYRKQGMLDFALGCFRKAYAASNDLKQLKLACLYEVGWCQFCLLRFDEAIETLSSFLEQHKSPSFRAFAGYQLAMSYAMTDRWEEAKKTFKLVPGWVRPHYTFDQYAARKAKHYLHVDRFTEIDKRMMLLFIYTESLKHYEAFREIAKLEPLVFHSMDKKRKHAVARAHRQEDAAVVLTCTGIHQRCLTRNKAAVESFETLLAMGSSISEEKWCLPYTLCELGEMAYSRRDIKVALDRLHAVKAFTNFDFDKPLMRRVDVTLDAIELLKNGEQTDDSLTELHYIFRMGEYYKRANVLAALSKASGVDVPVSLFDCIPIASLSYEPIPAPPSPSSPSSPSLTSSSSGDLLPAALHSQLLQQLTAPVNTPLNVALPWPLPPRRTNHALADIYHLINCLYKQQYSSLHELSQSFEWLVYSLACSEIRWLDVGSMSAIVRRCFLVNVHNIMMLHNQVNNYLLTQHNNNNKSSSNGAIENDDDNDTDNDDKSTSVDRVEKSVETRYQLGNFVLSCNDVKLLLQSKPFPKTDDSDFDEAMKHWSLKVDERALFMLSCGQLNCSRLQWYSIEEFEDALQSITDEYFEKFVKVHHRHKQQQQNHKHHHKHHNHNHNHQSRVVEITPMLSKLLENIKDDNEKVLQWLLSITSSEWTARKRLETAQSQSEKITLKIIESREDCCDLF